MHRLLLALTIACSTAAAAPSKSECASDADCVTTRIPEGSCCPSLCAPRVVTKTRAAELDSANAACRCADPQCAPEHTQTIAVCQAGRCAARVESMQ